MYEVFEHTADVGLRIRASTLDQLLVDAGQGLFSLIVTNLAEVDRVCERSYRIDRGGDDDYLLFDWLSELLYAFESERLLFSSFLPRLKADRFEATCWGQPMDLERHVMNYEVKAVTYHGLTVSELDGQWLGEVILDI